MPPPTNSLLRFTYLPISLLHLLSFHRMNSVLLLALERTCLTAPESLERSSSTWDMYVSQNLTQISSTGIGSLHVNTCTVEPLYCGHHGTTTACPRCPYFEGFRCISGRCGIACSHSRALSCCMLARKADQRLVLCV